MDAELDADFDAEFVEIGRFSKKDDKSWIMRSVEDELEHRRSLN